MKRRPFTTDEDKEIYRLINGGATYVDIAKSLRRNPSSIAVRARKLGLSSRANYFRSMGAYCTKTTIQKIVDLYQTRTATEVAEEIGLEPHQVRHALDIAYKNHKFKPKDKRRHDQWSPDDLITLLQYSGLQERGWIAKKLNRGTMHAVKECLGRMNSSSRYLNGLPQKLAEELLKVPLDAVKTGAGAPGPDGKCKTKIVPWVVMEVIIKRNKLRLTPAVSAGISALAKFQMRVHGCRSPFETAFKVASKATEV